MKRTGILRILIIIVILVSMPLRILVSCGRSEGGAGAGDQSYSADNEVGAEGSGSEAANKGGGMPEASMEDDLPEASADEGSDGDGADGESFDAGGTLFPERPHYEGLSSDTVSDYVPPSEYDLHEAEQLTGFCNLLPVKDEVKTASEEEARDIEAGLSFGAEGDEAEPDPLFCPYYGMLDDKSKHLYRQIYANALDADPSFRPVEKDVPAEQLFNIFSAVYDDHPELFWLDSSYSAVYKEDGELLKLELSFNETADDIEKSRAEFDKAAEDIAAGAEGSDNEKEKYVHDALLKNCVYRNNPPDQSAYSCLVTGETACAGYARAFSHIMKRLGIPCFFCRGYAGGDHGWNIVCLDGEYYNVDPAWDDADATGISYKFFNKTDADYGFTHIRKDLSVFLPSCSGEKYRDHDPEEYDDYVEVTDDASE